MKLFKPMAECVLLLVVMTSLRAEGSELTVTGSAASLNVFTKDAGLANVVGRICAVSGTNVVLHGNHQDVRVNDSFEGVHVRAAPVRILASHSYVLIHRSGVRDEYEVLLFSNEREQSRWKAGSRSPPVSAAAPETAEELAAVAVSAAEPAARARAIERIIYADASASMRDALASGTVTTGLQDVDPRVRAAALRALKDSGDESRSKELAQIASGDPDVSIRVQALELLAERDIDAALPVLRALSFNPDRTIGNRAHELLKDAHFSN